MRDKTLPITGGCVCGAVRYEATEPPQEVDYCHCRICQKAVGNLFFAYATFGSDAFRITQGEPKFYKTSAWMKRAFCANCGTPVADRYFKGSDLWSASIGSLDHPEDWPPSVHGSVESQIPWLTIHDDLPRMRSEEHPLFIAAQEAVERGKR